MLPTNVMYDVIIIGAGITGSFAAAELGKLGHHVCVLEKNPAAGQKTSCTGIVSSDCMELLCLDPSVIQQEMRSAKIFSPGGSYIKIERDTTQAYILDRSALDQCMARRASGCQAEYRFNTLVESLEQHDNYLSIHAASKGRKLHLKSRSAVIACGFSGSLTSALGLGHITYYAHGVQAEVTITPLEETEIYSGKTIAPGFFGWLVPTGGTNGKAGLLCGTNPRYYMDALLQKLIKANKIFPGDYHFSYGNIPLKALPRTYGDRFVVIGDAAGQAKPTTGGGIYFGLLAAREAIDVLSTGLKTDSLSAKHLSRYQRRWRKLLGHELAVDYWAHRFYRKLDNRQIDHIFDIIERHGIHDSLLASPDVTFDWHSNIIMDAIKHRSLQKSLERFKLRTPVPFKQPRRS